MSTPTGGQAETSAPLSFSGSSRGPVAVHVDPDGDGVDRPTRRPRPDKAPMLSRLAGSGVYRQNVVLRSVVPSRSLKLWRVYSSVRLACDQIAKGQQAEAWRGELCRANGLRWMPFIRGEKVGETELREKIERAA
jgi:hypothetical protein